MWECVHLYPRREFPACENKRSVFSVMFPAGAFLNVVLPELHDVHAIICTAAAPVLIPAPNFYSHRIKSFLHLVHCIVHHCNKTINAVIQINKTLSIFQLQTNAMIIECTVLIHKSGTPVCCTWVNPFCHYYCRMHEWLSEFVKKRSKSIDILFKGNSKVLLNFHSTDGWKINNQTAIMKTQTRCWFEPRGSHCVECACSPCDCVGF